MDPPSNYQPRGQGGEGSRVCKPTNKGKATKKSSQGLEGALPAAPKMNSQGPC